MARVISEIDGVSVIEQSAAYGSHPHPSVTGEVQYRDAIHVLLEDGREGYICKICIDASDDDDSRKIRMFNSTRSTVSHISSHSKHGKPNTDVNTIKAVLRAVKRNSEHKDMYVRAADELNKSGILTFMGKEWNNYSVRRMHQRYQHMYRVRVQKRAKTNDASRANSSVVQIARSKRSWNVNAGGWSTVATCPKDNGKVVYNGSYFCENFDDGCSWALSGDYPITDIADIVVCSILGINPETGELLDISASDEELITPRTASSDGKSDTRADDETSNDIFYVLECLHDGTARITHALNDLLSITSEIVNGLSDVRMIATKMQDGATVDVEILEKASKYDQMTRLLRDDH